MKTRKNISREKAGKSFFNSESAGATVVAAVLLLSIIFTVLAVVRIEYVPMWKTDAEQSHMSDVQKDMAELKSTADMVSLFTSSDSNTSAHGFPVTVSFSMGGGEIPILEPSKSSGTLSLNTERCKMIIIPQRSSVSSSPKIVDCGGITYLSNNREYLNQIFRYENGALILSQEDRSLMRQPPSFNIKQTNGNNYTVSIHAIKMKGDPDSISSNTDASLRLTGLYAEPIYDSNDSGGIDSFTCTILTGYPDAWISYLNETAKDAGLEYDTDYELDKISSDTVSVSFLSNGSKNLERLNLSESVIQAELGAGGSLESRETNGSESNEEKDKSVMELGKWYTFELSDNGTSIARLKDFEAGTDFSTDGSGKDKKYNNYNPLNAYSYNLNNIYYETFHFNSFTDFESSVSKVTVRMIYRSDSNPTTISSLSISGNSLDKLEPNDYQQQYWYLFNETRDVSVNYPSELNLSINIGQVNGNKDIYIDYIAVRLD